MDFRDIVHRRGAPGADRPDRLIGDDKHRARAGVRYRPVKLAADDIEGPAGIALRLGFTNADDADKAMPDHGLRLGADFFAGFLLIGAAFAMADDAEPPPGLLQPPRGDAAVFRALVAGRQSPRTDRPTP